MNYDVVTSSVAYEGKILRVEVDDILYRETGRKSKREVVVKDGFAMVVPVTRTGGLLTVRQFRHPFRRMAVSFPAGRVDPGEDPAAAALRELEEEAGVRAGRLTKLAELHEVPEFARSVGHVYVAEDLAPVPARREEGEATMTVRELPVQELRRMVAAGEVRSVTVIAALHHFLEYRAADRRAPPPRPHVWALLGLGAGVALAACVALRCKGRR